MNTLPDLSIVTFQSEADNSPVPLRLTWPSLSEMLTCHAPRSRKTGPSWSPASYREGTTRGNVNVESLSCFVLDIDNGTHPQDLWDRWQTPGGQDLAWCLHSSYKSTADAPRWRAVFPLAAPVPAAEWPAVWEKLAFALAGGKKTNGGHADTCGDVARLYYLPACPPDRREEAFTFTRDGVPLCPLDFPEPPIAVKPQAAPKQHQNSTAQSYLSLSDQDLITAASKAANGVKFSALYRGDTGGYGSQSEADLALCSMLAFFTGPDPNRIDRLFRGSGLFREKWDARHHGDGTTYGQGTVQEALAGKIDFYTPAGTEYTRGRGSARKVSPTAEAPSQPDDEWDLPVPFGTSNLPPFPLEALPSPLAEYVAEVAASTQVPIDMAAMMGLATVASTGARRAEVRIGDTHTEPLSLYIAAVMEPGSRKSSTLEAFAEPLREAERQMSAEKAGAYLTAKEKKEQETKRLSHMREQAAREKNEIERRILEDDATHLAANMTEVQELPRLLADDITMEKLAGLLAEQEDNAIAILSAEGGIFGILAGRYSAGAMNLDLILKGHSGETHRVDRVNQPPRYIKRPTITMGLAVQPDVLNSLADNPSFRGRGLLGRFLYTLPENLVGTRTYLNRPIDPNAKADYTEMIRALLHLASPITRDDPGARHTLRLTGAALSLWKRFYDDVEHRQSDGQDLAGIRDWASKLAGAVARIAGNLHLVENSREVAPWAKAITPETVAAAWAIGEYLIPHGLAAFGQMGADATHALARRVLKWIDRSSAEMFSIRDCFRAHQSSATMEELTAALVILSDHGHIRLEEQARSGPGRKPSPMYAVNPALKRPAGK